MTHGREEAGEEAERDPTPRERIHLAEQLAAEDRIIQNVLAFIVGLCIFVGGIMGVLMVTSSGREFRNIFFMFVFFEGLLGLLAVYLFAGFLARKSDNGKILRDSRIIRIRGTWRTQLHRARFGNARVVGLTYSIGRHLVVAPPDWSPPFETGAECAAEGFEIGERRRGLRRSPGVVYLVSIESGDRRESLVKVTENGMQALMKMQGAGEAGFLSGRRGKARLGVILAVVVGLPLQYVFWRWAQAPQGGSTTLYWILVDAALLLIMGASLKILRSPDPRWT